MALPAQLLDRCAGRARCACSTACEREAACARAHPQLRARLARACSPACRARSTLPHPLTGAARALRADARSVARRWCAARCMCRRWPPRCRRRSTTRPQGRYEPLVGLARAAVVAQAARQCADGHALLGGLRRGPAAPGVDRPTAPGADFGAQLRARSTSASAPTGRAARCRPRSTRVPPSAGRRCCCCQRRHSTRRRRRATASAWRAALGPKARHVVVPNAGHGVMALGCMRDVVFRFVDAADDARRCAVDAGCATAHPAARRRSRRSPAAAAAPMIEVDGLAKRSPRSGRGRGRATRPVQARAGGRRASGSARRTAASPACSARTAPARRPRCACSPA